eukprot:4368970-Amphidinium_carterae.1
MQTELQAELACASRHSMRHQETSLHLVIVKLASESAPSCTSHNRARKLRGELLLCPRGPDWGSDSCVYSILHQQLLY